MLPKPEHPLNGGSKLALSRGLAGALLMHGSLAGCVAKAPLVERYSTAAFICEGGTSFQVRFSNDHVRVETMSGIYSLERRPSSVGRKYASPDTAFISDEERAVLTGADGGPFKHCHAI